MQKTVKKSVTLNGNGLHSNQDVTLTIKPADENHGIVFKRVDLPHLSEEDKLIPALWHNVSDTTLCSMIANDKKVMVSTIEHLMAALRALGIDNALIEIDADEVPILDGSSKEIIEEIEKIGLKSLNAPRKAIRVLREVTYQDGDRKVTLRPSHDDVPRYKVMIDYADPTIGKQEATLKLVNGDFKHDIADCRTFCLYRDIQAMQSAGKALGGTLKNAVVVDDHGVMNEGGLLCENEFARHKLLDAVGDLALAGGLVLGCYESERAGHEMNNKILRALFADERNYEIVDHYVEFENEPPIAYDTVRISHPVPTRS